MPKPILLVEDDRIDAMTVQRAIKELNVTNPLHITTNGEEALDYLQNHAEKLPTLILLDINMPRMNGIEFLEIIKGDPKFKRIPVVVLTTSTEDQDRFEAFNLGVSGYMVKPVDYMQFIDVVKTIHVYWQLSERAES